MGLDNTLAGLRAFVRRARLTWRRAGLEIELESAREAALGADISKEERRAYIERAFILTCRIAATRDEIRALRERWWFC